MYRSLNIGALALASLIKGLTNETWNRVLNVQTLVVCG